VATEELILFPARAICASDATHYKHGDADCNEDRKHVRVRGEPMNHGLHKPKSLCLAMPDFPSTANVFDAAAPVGRFPIAQSVPL
jgi:hypothetical protein